MYSYRSSSDERRTRCPWIVAFFFLLGQIQVSLQAAEFGWDHHNHDGVPCAVQFLGEAANELCKPNFETIGPPRLAGIAYFKLTRERSLGRSVGISRNIRGPPNLLI